MASIDPIPVLIVLGTAILVASWLSRIHPPKQDTYASIDGLRGYLALFVFIHHASIWLDFNASNTWRPPSPDFYNNIGQASVAMFFMVTAFLFTSKLIDSGRKDFDWSRFLASRIARITPMYLFAIMLVILIAHTTNKPTNIDIDDILKAFHWLLFTIPGAPDMNNIKNTFTIIAGVTWTLPYEWIFYFSLPLIALTLLRKTSTPYLMLSTLFLAIITYYVDPNTDLMKPFIAGFITAFIVRIQGIQKIAKSHIGSLAVIGLLFASTVLETSIYNTFPLLLISIAFTTIASGNSLWGALTSRPSRLLGEISYSVYLLHGIILYMSFKILDLSNLLTSTTPYNAHWIVITLITPLIIAFSLATYLTIERPGMKSVNTLAKAFQLPRHQ